MITSILTNKTLISVIVIIGMSTTIFLMGKQISKLKRDNERIEYNFEAANKSIDSLIGKNGELHYFVDGLTLDKKELENTKQNLTSEIEEMELKIKKLESTSNVEIRYIVKKDSTEIKTEIIKKDSVKQFKTTIEDKWIKNSWSSEIINNSLIVKDYSLEINDDIITAVEFKTKGILFWKRKIGYTIHVKSKNPYSKIDKIEYVKMK